MDEQLESGPYTGAWDGSAQREPARTADMRSKARQNNVEHFEVAILGAGFGGLAVAHRLARDGIDDLIIFERDDGVGGTWRANNYPGAACDVPSHLYSLSFALNPNWSRVYSEQPEILQYIEDCYDRFDVRDKLRLSTDIVAARWSETDHLWHLRDSCGVGYSARILVSAIGMFNTPAIPAIPGMNEFSGTLFHSARWDHHHDLTGRTVAVVGTGASAIQIVPAIAEHTARLDLYQRTPVWVLPRRDRPYSAQERREFAANPDQMIRHRQELYDQFEQTIAYLANTPATNALATVARDYLAIKVADPRLRGLLSPDYSFGCKRTMTASNYYPALQRDNVNLVTTDIERITATGIRTVDGVERQADTIVMCTGFRAAEYLCGIDVVGRGGTSIHAYWAGVPRAYHGIAVPGFPNFFMLYGPNTNASNSILLMLEAQAQFVASALAAMRERDATSLDVTDEAMSRYVRELERDLQPTVWTSGCASYFRNAAGDIVTQLPRTSAWYSEATQAIHPADFTFGEAQCTIS